MQIFGKIGVSVQPLEIRHGVHEFFDIRFFIDVFVVIARKRGVQPRVRHDFFHEIQNGQFRGCDNPTFDLFAERRQFRTRARVQPRFFSGEQRLVIGYAAFCRIFFQRIQRFRADTAAGKIHDTYQRFVIERIGHQPKIRQHVLDFLTIVEFESAENFKRNRVGGEFLLERTGERVHAHQHGEIGIRVSLAHEIADRAGDEKAFVTFFFRLVYAHLFALFFIRPERFLLSSAVIADRFVRHGENIFRRAIVPLQFEYLRRRERFLEIEYIFYFRAAPAVNGLIVVAHGEKITVHGGKKAHDLELHFVRILKLVHHDIAETPAEIFAGFFIRAQQPERTA